MSVTRSDVIALIDHVRDDLLIAKNAVEEDDIEKAASAIERASLEISETAKELRS